MALGAAKLFDVQLAVGTTGYASKDPPRVKAPFAYVSIWARKSKGRGSVVETVEVPCEEMSRVQAQQHVAKVAFEMLLDAAQEWA